MRTSAAILPALRALGIHYQMPDIADVPLSAMDQQLHIEIVGLKNASCSPFPCDEQRTCGLTACHPTGKLLPAVDALRQALKNVYGEKVMLTLVLIDDQVPEHVREILKDQYPPIPFVLIDRELVPMGRISLEQIKKEIDRRLA